MFEQPTGARRLAVIVAMLLCASASYAKTATSKPQLEKPDELCQRLFDEYVVTGTKGDSADAADLIASRGRNVGFVKPVLDELRKGNINSEYLCVRILGRVLEEDAADRDAIKAKVNSQRAAFICLPSTVVPELIARAQSTRFRLNDYILALARARDERCKEIFLRVLTEPSGGDYTDGNKFLAAVGLANLGDPAGVQWLLAHCEDRYPATSRALPFGTPNTDSCCVLALRSLGASTDLKTRADLESWWNKQPKPFALKQTIRLREMW